MKQYKLLKDLPDLKAGVIFEDSKESDDYVCGDYKFLYNHVEDNTEWFEEIRENMVEIKLKKRTIHEQLLYAINYNYIEKDKINYILRNGKTNLEIIKSIEGLTKEKT